MIRHFHGGSFAIVWRQSLLELVIKLLTVFASIHGSCGVWWGSTIRVQQRLHLQAGALGLTPGSCRSPGEGNGYPLQYSCLENPRDREAWWAIVHGVAKESDITEQLSTHVQGRGPGLTAGQGTRFHMPQLRVRMLQQKPDAATLKKKKQENYL